MIKNQVKIKDINSELDQELSYVLEALKRLSAGDPEVKIPETSRFKPIAELKHMVNLNAQGLKEIVELTHEFAIGLAEHFDVLQRVSKGDLAARISGISKEELLEALKNITNQMIESVSIEITERKQAEQKLKVTIRDLDSTNRQLEEAIERAKTAALEAEYAYIELRQIFDSTADGMFVIDKDFNITRMNQKLLNWMKLEAKEVINKKCYDVIGTEVCSGPDCPLIKILNGEKHIEIDIEKERSDGTKVPFLYTASAIGGPEGDILGIVVNYKDITERKLVEQEQLRHEKLQGVLEMAGAVCHEMNQPLMGISGYSELLIMDLPKEATVKEKIIKIKEQADRLGRITQKLMGITKYETKEYLKSKIIDIDKATE